MGINVPNEVLRVGGFAELTAANSDRVGRKIRADLNGHAIIEIDLSRTTFMDCAGLGALIALRNLARARNGGVRLLNPTPTVQLLFDVVRAGEIFEIVNAPTDPPRCLASLPAWSTFELSTRLASHGQTPPRPRSRQVEEDPAEENYPPDSRARSSSI